MKMYRAAEDNNLSALLADEEVLTLYRNLDPKISSYLGNAEIVEKLIGYIAADPNETNEEAAKKNN